MSAAIKVGFVFDKDGTLQDSERDRQRASCIVLKKLGHTPPMHILPRMIGGTKEQGDTLLTNAIPGLDTQLFREERANVLRKLYSMRNLGGDQVAQMPGAEAALIELRRMGHKIGVATGTFQQEAEHELRLGKLLDKVDCVVGRDQVKEGKPSPEIFLKTAAKLGIKPENCIVIGDTHYDVDGARAANMKVVLVPDLLPCRAEVAQRADLVCSSLFEFMDLYRQGWGQQDAPQKHPRIAKRIAKSINRIFE